MGTACDLYLDWHTGSDGNAITDAIAAGACRPTSPVDVPEVYPGATLTAMQIEADAASPVAGLVTCDGVEYDIGDTTQGAIYDHTGNYEDMVTADMTSAPGIMSMGFMMKTGLHEEWEWHALSGLVGSGEWALLAPRYFESALHLYMHTSQGYSAGDIAIAVDTWYWVTLQYNATAGYGYLAIYNPSTWAQVGSTVSLAFAASPSGVSYWTVGQHASQGNTEASSTWYGPVIFDWTDGTFPLLPEAPGPPPGHRVYETYIAGVPANGLWHSPSLVLANAWDVTIQKIAGQDRAIPWSIRKVSAGAITEPFASSATIGTTEYSLPRDAAYAGDAPQSDDGLYQVFLDVNAVAFGDIFRFRVYEEAVV